MQSACPVSPAVPVAVAVALKDPLLRMGVYATLRSDSRFDVQGDFFADGLSVGNPAGPRQAAPDVVVMDYEDGIAAARASTSGRRSQAILIVTSCSLDSHIRSAIEVGILGYLILGCRLEEVVSAVQSVHRGIRYLSSAASQSIVDGFAYQKLTTRETDVLQLVVEGLSNKMIARDLDLAVGTVKAHVRAILEKLDAKSRTQAAAQARRRGLVEAAATEA